MRQAKFLSTGILVTSLSACVSYSYDVPADAVPDTPVPVQQESMGSRVYWSNVESFGAVPANLQATGDGICSELDDDDFIYRAAGYHPDALDLDEEPLSGGGFYCQRSER